MIVNQIEVMEVARIIGFPESKVSELADAHSVSAFRLVMQTRNGLVSIVPVRAQSGQFEVITC